MAYVAISAELRDSVRRNISSMKRRELGAAPGYKQTEVVRSHQITQQHYELAWGEYLPLKAQIPQHWCRRSCSLELKCERAIDDETSVSAHMTFEFPDYLVAPPSSDNYMRKTVSEDFPGMKELLDNAVAQHEIEMRWNKVQEQVTKFINNCKSLNEALKLWPDVKLYIPQNYLERVEQKVVKPKESQAAEILKQIDTDTATAAVVGLRFVEAAKGNV